MSRTRHDTPSRLEADIVVRSLALTLPSGFAIPTHAHDWSQLIYATSGVMTVHTEDGTFVVPSRRAVWVPGGASHSIETTGCVAMRTLYLRPDVAPEKLRACVVMNVSPLLRELVLDTVRRGHLYLSNSADARFAAFLVDQLIATPEAPLDLRQPRDARARYIANIVCARPGENATLEELALGSGASPRTLERLFQREVGMTFGRWRQQVRLLRALRLLAKGSAVSAVALDVGYNSTSAFIAMFKRTLGKTPKRYFEIDHSM